MQFAIDPRSPLVLSTKSFVPRKSLMPRTSRKALHLLIIVSTTLPLTRSTIAKRQKRNTTLKIQQ